MMFAIILIGALYLVYVLYTWIYRLYLSPISIFPGPRLAALTFWYEGYYDIYCQGRYTWKIQELHQQYGPIIRINPEEIHIQDPSFYDQVYVGPSRKTDKWGWSARMFGTSKAAVGTVDHGLHKIRRGGLNPFFSKSAVVEMESVIQQNVNLLLERLKGAGVNGGLINLSDAFTALSADVISSFCFGESYDFLQHRDFNPEWRKFMTDLSQGTHLMKQFGWAYSMITPIVPDAIVALLHPLTRELVRLQHSIRSKVIQSRAQVCEKEERSACFSRSVFETLLRRGSLPASELKTSRLSEEGLTLIGAGTVTTAHTLETITFNLLRDPRNLQKLRAELGAHCNEIGSADSIWTTLAQLPYISAVLSEGLRLSFGVAHRLPRISPDQPLQYQGWTIPAGTPVSMTNMFIHLDPTIFPEPRSFRPERWLGAFPATTEDGARVPQVEPSLAKTYLLPFSKGTRSCVAMNLAYAELYYAVYSLFRPTEHGGVDLKLYRTEVEDMEIVHDFFSPHTKKSSKGLRVTLK